MQIEIIDVINSYIGVRNVFTESWKHIQTQNVYQAVKYRRAFPVLLETEENF